jgi:hypothetical protein
MIPALSMSAHFQRLDVNVLAGGDVGLETPLQPRDGLGQRQIEMVAQHRAHLIERPVGWVRSRQEPGDVVGVRVPACDGFVHGLLVSGLGGAQDVPRDQDVVREKLGQPIAGGLPVERLDRVADVDLVLQQSVECGLRRRRAGRELDDEHPRPRDVVLPQLSHRVVERELLGRDLLGGAPCRICGHARSEAEAEHGGDG